MCIIVRLSHKNKESRILAARGLEIEFGFTSTGELHFEKVREPVAAFWWAGRRRGLTAYTPLMLGTTNLTPMQQILLPKEFELTFQDHQVLGTYPNPSVEAFAWKLSESAEARLGRGLKLGVRFGRNDYVVDLAESHHYSIGSGSQDSVVLNVKGVEPNHLRLSLEEGTPRIKVNRKISVGAEVVEAGTTLNLDTLPSASSDSAYGIERQLGIGPLVISLWQ